MRASEFRAGARRRGTQHALPPGAASAADLALPVGQSRDNYLNETDGELFAALHHADELGPWEQTVQQTTLFVGLAVWQDLDRPAAGAYADPAARSIAQSSENVRNRESYTRFDLVCAMGI